jgi:hypothetical protein
MEKEDPMKEVSETSYQILRRKETNSRCAKPHTANTSNKLNKTDQQKPGQRQNLATTQRCRKQSE